MALDLQNVRIEGVYQQRQPGCFMLRVKVPAGVISAEQARQHPLRNVVTRALGGRAELMVDVQARRLRAGEVLLLCSDGLTTMLTDADIGRVISSAGGDLALAAEALVAAANGRGGEDNITVILLGFED